MQSDQRYACAQGSTFAHPIARINIARRQLRAVALLFADPNLVVGLFWIGGLVVLIHRNHRSGKSTYPFSGI